MKKITCIAMILLLSLTACKDKQSSTSTDSTKKTNIASEADSTKETKEQVTSETSTKVNINITDEKLCEYAAYYYYIRHGEKAPVVEIDSREGNIVKIHLYENQSDKIVTCDWYDVDVDTLMAHNVLGSEFSLAYNEEGYTDEELCNMASAYYEKKYNKKAPNVKVDHEKDGFVSIHLYENVDNHTSTIDWYGVDRHMAIGADLFQMFIDLR